jgi:hypothetical protein
VGIDDLEHDTAHPEDAQHAQTRDQHENEAIVRRARGHQSLVFGWSAATRTGDQATKFMR